MQIGKLDFNEKLKSLSWTNFKKFWNEGYEVQTGLTAEQAAGKFGIKVPEKKNKKGGE